MSKTVERELTETEYNELRDHELDTVSGGLVVLAIIQPLIALVLPHRSI